MEPVAFLIAIVVFFLVVALFNWLWNITMPQVFALKRITYWQAFRLLIIAGMLFGSESIVRFSSG